MKNRLNAYTVQMGNMWMEQPVRHVLSVLKTALFTNPVLNVRLDLCLEYMRVNAYQFVRDLTSLDNRFTG